jgi:hypothetical protein
MACFQLSSGAKTAVPISGQSNLSVSNSYADS